MLINSTFRLIVAVALTGMALPSFAQDQASPDNVPSKARLEEAVRAQLPVPPAGFTWQLFKNAALLRPDGWNEGTIEPKAGTVPMSVYAASPEQFSDSKPFEMGVTLQIISEPRALRDIPAKKAALLYLKPFLEAHRREDFLILDRKASGDFERTVARYRDAPPGLKPVIVHKFILANDVADSVHVFTFESPEESWKENWDRFGTPILGKVNVFTNLPSR